MAMRTNQGSSSHKKQVNIGSIIKTPLRAVSKALDLYVKGITNLTTNRNRTSKRANVMIATLESQKLPRSFSTSRIASYEEPPESALVRSISAAPSSSRPTRINSVELDNYLMQQRRIKLQSYAASKGHVPRSCSVGMGKIDEERASSFRNDNIHKSEPDTKVKRSMFSSFRWR